jgi:hypothetical protein
MAFVIDRFEATIPSVAWFWLPSPRRQSLQHLQTPPHEVRRNCDTQRDLRELNDPFPSRHHPSLPDPILTYAPSQPVRSRNAGEKNHCVSSEGVFGLKYPIVGNFARCCACAARGQAAAPAEKRDELAPNHSITSVAMAKSCGGTSMPSSVAVPRLRRRAR